MPTLAAVKELSEAELVAQLLQRDAVAFDMAFARYATPLLRLAYRLVGSLDDAEDIVQDVFVGLPLALRHYDERGTFGVWLRRVTTRTALMHRRAAMRRQRSAVAATADGPQFAPPGATLDRLTLGAAIATLPDALRDVFVLFHIEHLTHTEIAELLGIRRGTAEVRLHRATRRLRELLENDR